jgi:hypothetical protein
MSFRVHLTRVAVEHALQRARELVAMAGVVLVVLLVIDRRAGLAWAAVGLTAAATLGIHWLRWRVPGWFAPRPTNAYGRAAFTSEREAAERSGLSSTSEDGHG